jgi:hypothetical protein
VRTDATAACYRRSKKIALTVTFEEIADDRSAKEVARELGYKIR